MKTFVIAEMGSSWLFGKRDADNFRHGLKLIRLAAKAGASACKVQWVSDPATMAKRRKIKGDPYRHLSWPIEWQAVFAEESHRLKMEYISTVFLPDDVVILAPFVDRFKVASLEWHSISLRDTLDRQPKPIIYSTGVCETYDIHGAFREQDSMLHCTASYPCPPEDMNLLAMKRYMFSLSYDGLSDHSGNVLTGGFAVMRGAAIIEAHIRLNETPKTNPDYEHSFNPDQFKQYIENIKLAEVMLGDGNKRIMPGERSLMKHRVRR